MMPWDSHDFLMNGLFGSFNVNHGQAKAMGYFQLREILMKAFWISVVFAIAVVALGFLWLSKASEDYAEKHPDVAMEAKQSLEDYNSAVDRHNKQVGKTNTTGK